MHDFFYVATDKALPIEIEFPAQTVLDEIAVTLRTSASAGNRTLRLEKVASTKQICSLLNQLKAFQGAIVALLNEEGSNVDTNYAATAVANATNFATADALADDLKAKHNAILTKLDGDDGITSTDYASACSVAASSATTQATLVTIANEIRTDMLALVGKLDVDAAELDGDYAAAMGGLLPALLTSSNIDSDTTQQASETILHLFRKGMADAEVANAAHLMNLTDHITIPSGASLILQMSTVVDASNDKVDVMINGK